MQCPLLAIKRNHNVPNEQDEAADDVHEIPAEGDAPSERVAIASNHLESQRHFPWRRSSIMQESRLVHHSNRIGKELKAQRKELAAKAQGNENQAQGNENIESSISIGYNTIEC